MTKLTLRRIEWIFSPPYRLSILASEMASRWWPHEAPRPRRRRRVITTATWDKMSADADVGLPRLSGTSHEHDHTESETSASSARTGRYGPHLMINTRAQELMGSLVQYIRELELTLTTPWAAKLKLQAEGQREIGIERGDSRGQI